MNRRAEQSGILAQSQVHVAAFGKHPARDDHLQGIGVDTAGLEAVRRILYSEGIGWHVNRGSWAGHAGEAHTFYHHVFVWSSPTACIIGRLWSSADGKGRKMYPMVICVQLPAGPTPWLLQRVLPWILKGEILCRRASTMKELEIIVSFVRAKVGESLAEAGKDDVFCLPPEFSNGEALQNIMSAFGDMPEHGGFYGFLGGIEETALADYRSHHVRVPIFSENPEKVMAAWLAAVRWVTGHDHSVVLLYPQKRAWMDILIRNPIKEQFYCVGASLDDLPVTTYRAGARNQAYPPRTDALRQGMAAGKLDFRAELGYGARKTGTPETCKGG